jgi:hypothetical protein
VSGVNRAGRAIGVAAALFFLAGAAGAGGVAVARPVARTHPEPAPRVDAEDDQGFFEKYVSYFDRKLEELSNAPIWGLTAQLPKGVLKLRYEWNPARADSYFDADGELITLLPPIEIRDVPAPGERILVDPRVSGSGAGHTFQIGYGFTGNFDMFVELPFTSIETDLDLRILRNGQPADRITATVFQNYITSNGRPLPGSEFDGTFDVGDLQAGVSWNFVRTEHFSASIAPRLFFPTGTQANPNNELPFLLGPEIDRGTGAWALGFAHTFDLRPVRWLIFNLELGSTYRFSYERETASWLPITDCRRIQDPARRAALGCGAVAYDRAYDLEQSAILPDLSGLDRTYTVEPTISYRVQTGFIVEIIPIPFQFAYNFERQEAPNIRATGAGDSGPAFERLVDQLALFEASELHTIGMGVSLPLFPLYVPATVTIGTKWGVAGKNAIRLKANYSLAIETFFPIGDAF